MKGTDETFESWAIVELMGHRRIGGLATSPGGPGGLAGTLRVDIHERDEDGEDKVTTQFYGGTSIYCLTPTTEEVARRVAQGFHRPIGQYNPALPSLPEAAQTDRDFPEEDEADVYDDGASWEDDDGIGGTYS